MSHAFTDLFDPGRHERVNAAPWSEKHARAALDAIVDDSLAAFTPQGLWPAHALDEPATPHGGYSMLYLGAGGVIWALRRLARLGFVEDDRLHFGDVVPTLVERNRALGETQQGGTASFLMGDSGLLLLQWQARPTQDLADRLFETVQGNLRHPAREPLWGSPGTLLAALHMAQATGERRWVGLFERGARILLEEMVFDEAVGGWTWQQDLYGRVRRFLGAGHGLAGNVFPFLHGAALLPGELVDRFTERAWSTLDRLALRADGCANWHPVHDPVAVTGRLPLVQDCHGAPGIVVRLASAPQTAQWDRLLREAGELTWRAGPLRKGPGLCHGTAGNGYAFLKLWTRTSDPLWLARARSFAMHAIDQVEAQRLARGGGRHSLWTGDVGVALYLCSCIAADSNFPTLDVF
ncbi:lanthionine synthetase C family protein [Caenimonas terrae]|uniref:Lanthionine synthetase C family protein n=1 Tax=Caenimonas terrae TaxID=696074 RepID=A0ABW0NG27_9BURK